MPDEIMSLRSSMEKSADADLLREMIGFAAERLIELEVGALTGAAHGERSAERPVQRSGCHDLDRQTWADTVELRIPEPREGSYFPAFLEPRRMTDPSFRTRAFQGARSSRPSLLGGWRRPHRVRAVATCYGSKPDRSAEPRTESS